MSRRGGTIAAERGWLALVSAIQPTVLDPLQLELAHAPLAARRKAGEVLSVGRAPSNRTARVGRTFRTIAEDLYRVADTIDEGNAERFAVALDGLNESLALHVKAVRRLESQIEAELREALA